MKLFNPRSLLCLGPEFKRFKRNWYLASPPAKLDFSCSNSVFVLRSRGGNKEIFLTNAQSAFILWGSQKLSTVLKIIEVDYFPQHIKFVRKNNLIKNSILKLAAGPLIKHAGGMSKISNIDDKNLLGILKEGFVYAKTCSEPYNEGYVLTRLLEGSELESHLKMTPEDKWKNREIVPESSRGRIRSIF